MDPAKHRTEEAIRLYTEEKLNSAQIGEILGIHRHSVINILHRKGIKPRTAQESLRLRLKRKLPNPAEVVDAYVNGRLPLQEIGEKFEVSAGWVQSQVENAGHKLRTPQEGRWVGADRLFGLSAEQRKECGRDPAYEARNKIADRIYCKECFLGLKASGRLRKHVVRRHADLGPDPWSEYLRRHPGARVTTFAQVARQQKCDVQELMASFAASYLTPAKLDDCRRDPEWENRNGLNFVACRICGLNSTGELGKHVEKQHGLTWEEYLSKYPGAPRYAKTWIERCKKRNAETQELARKARKRSAKASRPRKKKDEKNQQFFKIGREVETRKRQLQQLPKNEWTPLLSSAGYSDEAINAALGSRTTQAAARALVEYQKHLSRNRVAEYHHNYCQRFRS